MVRVCVLWIRSTLFQSKVELLGQKFSSFISWPHPRQLLIYHVLYSVSLDLLWSRLHFLPPFLRKILINGNLWATHKFKCSSGTLSTNHFQTNTQTTRILLDFLLHNSPEILFNCEMLKSVKLHHKIWPLRLVFNTATHGTQVPSGPKVHAGGRRWRPVMSLIVPTHSVNMIFPIYLVLERHANELNPLSALVVDTCLLIWII